MLREWGVSIAQPHRSPIEAIGVIEIQGAIELHHMLLLTREQFHLNFIQVYLQGGQADRPKLAEISARSIETPNMITAMGTYDSRHEQGTQEK